MTHKERKIFLSVAIPALVIIAAGLYFYLPMYALAAKLHGWERVTVAWEMMWDLFILWIL